MTHPPFVVPRPGVRFLPEPTPLHRLDRLSAELGREIWIKRDDLTAVGVGGNKIRKLEYLVADAKDQGADTLVTIGAVQSNHCRATAAAAAIVGLDCHLVLTGDEPAEHRGNLLLDDMLGATYEFWPGAQWDEVSLAALATCDRLRADGKTPYLMPPGGSTAVGAMGYVSAYSEFLDQCHQHGFQPAAIVHANGSGGTQAGLVAGQALLGGDVSIIGVAVAIDADIAVAVCDALADDALDLLGRPRSNGAPAVVLDGYLGQAYGESTPEGELAQQLLLRREGILLDPVYTAKAFSAILGDDPAIPDGPTVFWHTGGAPAVFA